MAINRRDLLETLLALCDDGYGPVTVSQLARRMGADPEEVQEEMDALKSCELVKPHPKRSGYRPTVTAREFLDLDIDEGKFVIMEFADDEA